MSVIRPATFVVFLNVNAVLVAGCHASDRAAPATTSSKTTSAELSPRAPPSSLEVPIAPRSGSSLTGTAVLTELPEGVRVVIDVAGASPGSHGAHVHEKGDCSSADAKSAGEHFEPDGHPHDLPPTEPRHLGDLGNIVVGEDGTGHLEITAPRANLRPFDMHSYVNRAIVIHAKPDDGSQPSGNSGDRIGCGEVRRSQAVDGAASDERPAACTLDPRRSPGGGS
jgi:Cu-Zn family superoxide dismutase